MRSIFFIGMLLTSYHSEACTIDYKLAANQRDKVVKLIRPVELLKVMRAYQHETKLIVKQVPILCYHNIKPHNAGKPDAYTITIEEFRAHIKMLSDSGYQIILPDQLYLFLTAGAALPKRPVMITFDDSHEEHFSIAAPVLRSYGFKAVFFVMNVTIGKRGYLSASQIKSLSDDGHVIGSHTWDHQNLKKLDYKKWEFQVNRPVLQMEKITGHQVPYFAYPFGEWDEHAVSELKRRGIKAAFQLSGRRSEKEPLYTIRRILVAGTWSAKTLYKCVGWVSK